MASIEKRGNGSYRFEVIVGYDAMGKPIRRRKTVKAKGIAEAKKKASIFEAEVLSGEYFKPQKMRFTDFVQNEWEPKYASRELAHSTLKTYKHHFKNHILPIFGHMNLEQIQPMHIVSFIDDLQKPGARKDGKGDSIATGTIEVIYRALKNVLTRATDWKLIKENPMKGVKKPTVRYKKYEFFDADEAQKVIVALYKEPLMWRLFMLGSMLGGFRRGEVLALEWKDINFDDLTIEIDESISDTVNSKAIIGDTKSESSNDIVDMPEWYMDELQEYHHQWKKNKLAVGDKWKGDDRNFVFHIGFGKPIYHTTPSQWWKEFLKRHDLKIIRLHDLRHTTATLLIEDGANMKAIQKRLRHSKYQTTADIYGHVTKKLSRDTADKFNKYDPRQKNNG